MVVRRAGAAAVARPAELRCECQHHARPGEPPPRGRRAGGGRRGRPQRERDAQRGSSCRAPRPSAPCRRPGALLPTSATSCVRRSPRSARTSTPCAATPTCPRPQRAPMLDEMAAEQLRARLAARLAPGARARRRGGGTAARAARLGDTVDAAVTCCAARRPRAALELRAPDGRLLWRVARRAAACSPTT